MSQLKDVDGARFEAGYENPKSMRVACYRTGVCPAVDCNDYRMITNILLCCRTFCAMKSPSNTYEISIVIKQISRIEARRTFYPHSNPIR